ncbi:hypothetical protein DL96DRAFT_1581784 [Flagelloscypha sp. PMI_526]|nr:hypothetical protein DL96DRAFT_1581784 [Flagelloscypha sp. PMI_526]
MKFLKVAVRTLKKLDRSANKEQVIRTVPDTVPQIVPQTVIQTKSFPPLPVDIIRIICEFAATLNQTTAHNLSMSSKEIREWVLPERFQRVTIRKHRHLIRLSTSTVLRRIGPLVRNLSLQPGFENGSIARPVQMTADLSSFLDALPNLILAHGSIWDHVPIFLPTHVSSLEIGSHYLDPPTNSALDHSATKARTHITHIYSVLNDPPTPSLFNAWTALTHIFFDIRPQYQLGNSIATSTFPLSPPFHPLPSSIISCILMDAQSCPWDFIWTINQVLVDLILGDTDTRIVFCAAEECERWIEVQIANVTSPAEDLSWIREGLKDAILYHNKWSHKYDMVWIEAEEIRIRRKEARVRAAVCKLFSLGTIGVFMPEPRL